MFTISSLVQFKVSGQKSHDPVKLNKRLRCHVCRIRQKKRKTTFFTCSSCTDEKDNKFGLCMPECFNKFHKRKTKTKCVLPKTFLFPNCFMSKTKILLIT
uniref:PiggyBac transposable element-derived protein 4 C-terminal zinc-finger domain-containing protein n=1 Tax=Homalodisca liturata TaxID=320908 RepID=A0A1B6HLE2_9HEMI